jgi:hypothetical protein
MREKGVVYLGIIFILLTKVISTAPVYADDLIAFEQNFEISSVA